VVSLEKKFVEYERMVEILKKRLPLLSSTFLRITATAGISVVLQLYMAELGASLFEIGSMSSLRGLATIVFSPIWGSLSDRNGRKRYLLISSFLSFFILLFYPTVSSALIVIMLVSLFAATNSGFTPIATALSSETSKRRGVEISFFNTAISVGNFTSKIMIGFTLLIISVKTSLWIFILIFALGIVPLFWINEKRTHQARKKRNLFVSLEDIKLMKESNLWSVYVGTFLRQFGVNGMLSIVAVYMVYSVKLSPFMVGFLASLNPLVQIFSILLFARITERKRSSKSSILFGMFFSVLSLLLFAMWKSSLGIGLAYASLGLGYGAFISGTTTYISFAVSSDLRGKFMGFFTSARSVGVVLGSLTAGIMSQLFGYENAFFVMCALVLSAFFMILFFFKEKAEKMKVA
jgi:MFS family permease